MEMASLIYDNSISEIVRAVVAQQLQEVVTGIA